MRERETQVDEQEKLVGGGTMDQATLGLGLKLDQIEEEEFADRSSLDSDGAGGKEVVGRQPAVKKVIFDTLSGRCQVKSPLQSNVSIAYV